MKCYELVLERNIAPDRWQSKTLLRTEERVSNAVTNQSPNEAAVCLTIKPKGAK